MPAKIAKLSEMEKNFKKNQTRNYRKAKEKNSTSIFVLILHFTRLAVTVLY